MIDKTLLGRYECIRPENNNRKFWHIVFDKSKQVYLATWGRIGNNSPTPKEYTESEATKKIKYKMSEKKGYAKVDGYKEVIGSQSVHFIKEFCSG